MDFMEMYAQKKMTAEQAASLVKSRIKQAVGKQPKVV